MYNFHKTYYSTEMKKKKEIYIYTQTHTVCELIIRAKLTFCPFKTFDFLMHEFYYVQKIKL